VSGVLFQLIDGDGRVLGDGVEFPDDTVVLRYRGDHPSTAMWATMREAIASYGPTSAVVWQVHAE